MVTLGAREGMGGGGALLYLYTSLGTAFIFSSTGRRPVECVCVCEERRESVSECEYVGVCER